MQIDAKIQMEKWDGEILDVNQTVKHLGQRKCGQLLGAHALSGCDTVSYPFGKGKQSILKLLENDIPGLDNVLGEPEATQPQLKATVDAFFLLLYGQKSCATVNNARARLYLSRKKPPPLKRLPPTDANLQQHVLGAHLQMLLWKAADQQHPPTEAQDITNFGWNIEDNTIAPTVSSAPVAPQVLLDVVSCNCTAKIKACSTGRCSCNNAGLSCTDYCKCKGGVTCCNHFSSRKIDVEEEEEEEENGLDNEDIHNYDNDDNVYD